MPKANQSTNVRTWSKTVPSYGLRLSDLDLYVLKNHDDLLRVLGYERVEGSSPRALVGWAVHMVFLFALVGGVSTLGGDMFSTYGGRTVRTGTADPLDNDIGVPLTSWCFAVVLIGVVLVAVRWLRSDRHRDGMEIGYLVATVACGALALGQLVSDRGLDAFAAPSIPVWAAAVCAAVLLAAVLLFSRGRRVPVPNNFRQIDTPDPQQAIALVEALEPKERDKLLGERRRAIERLRERGLIDAAEAAHVESLPLGASTTIAPARESHGPRSVS
ncbi:hypothetical protein [Kribbella speibonae]|uniref:Uncharacterized protein n=1 Tax=Kribbella speibonae TaxID=1572660 RepID=A0ABY2A753_9ACTN|nr:hypothetical protein [Kribbella speibonae]TCC24917.1 hypothetical protein E0H58_12015 [Kribbella speibonae]